MKQIQSALLSMAICISMALFFAPVCFAGKTTTAKKSKKPKPTTLVAKYHELLKKYQRLQKAHKDLRKKWLAAERKLAKLRRNIKKNAPKEKPRELSATVVKKKPGGLLLGGGEVGAKGAGGGSGGRFKTSPGIWRWSGKGKIKKKKKLTPKLKLGKPKVLGSLDWRIVVRVVRNHRAPLQYCYGRVWVLKPKLSGKIKLFFIINTKGRVKVAGISKTTMKNKQVENCLIHRIKYARFPVPKGGGNVHVTYPMYFDAR